MGADRDPNHLFPAFAVKYEGVLHELQAYLDKHHPGWTCKLVQGFRSAAYQHELYQEGRNGNPGRTVTPCDGYNKKSNHQSSLAADVAIFDGDERYIEEPPAELLAYYGHCLRAAGLEWGGDWRRNRDTPHGEWPPTDVVTYAKAEAWQRENGLR